MDSPGEKIAKRSPAELLPAAAALAYPFVLQAFHAAVSPQAGILSPLRVVGAAAVLLAALALPLLGFLFVVRQAPPASAFDLRARRLAYASIAAPPLFVFTGVELGVLGLSIPDILVWIPGWLIAGLLVWFGRDGLAPKPATRSIGGWRVAHGIAAAAIACFVLFHLTNHLFGLVGPQAHKAIMAAGRKVYRAPLVEPVLVLLLLFQVTSGLRLFWRWSSVRTDIYRVFQVGSGAYLSAFILTHMNSVFVSARAVHKIETDWGYASGAPTGLIHDAWNIRLVPHYALGVFFVLGHLASGLRIVMIAHGVNTVVADRLWKAGLTAGALISTAIMAGLCGVRV